MNQNDLREGIHYYFNEEGLMVFTKQYHLEKGFCCGMGCLHCPYNYEKVSKLTPVTPKEGFEETE